MTKKLIQVAAIWLCMLTSLTYGEQNQQVRIYAGPGAAGECLEHTMAALRTALGDHLVISYIYPKELLETNWEEQTALFVMPGGADIPYTIVLNGNGNEKIREFVERGGVYLGICAGSYYGGNFVDFAKDTICEVQGSRELAFFPGTVSGPILAPYDYESSSGARAATLLLPDGSCTVYYNGGGYFVDAADKPNTSVLAYYEGSQNHAAIVECRVGEGLAILSGVHLEYDPQFLDPSDPYLREIIPVLVQANTQRVQLLTEILKRIMAVKQ